MARLKTTITIAVEPSASVDAGWQFTVTVPPVAVVRDIATALGIDALQGMVSSLLSNDEVRVALRAHIAANEGCTIGEACAVPAIQALIMTATGIDPAKLLRPDCNDKQVADLIEPFCSAPEGFDPPYTWPLLSAANEPYSIAVLVAAGRAVYERVHGDVGAAEKKSLAP
jgi:hypothetical protein